MEIEYFLIAKVLSVHNRDGFLRVISYSDFPDRFFSLSKVFIDFNGEKKRFNVSSVKKEKDFFLLQFENFTSDEDCEIFLDKEIFVDNNDVVKPPPYVFFIHDLIGSQVFAGEEFLGVIEDVLQLSANDVYVVKSSDNREILIPALKNLIVEFNAEEKKMFLNPGDYLYSDEN